MSEYQFSNEDLLTMFHASPVGMLLVDDQGQIKFSNSKAQTIFNYTEKELNTLNVEQLVPHRYKARHSGKMQSYMSNPAPMAMGAGRVLPALMKGGEEFLVEIGLVPLQIRDHQMVLVSAIESSNKVLKVAAFHDPLTGLPNRNLFIELSNHLRRLAIRNTTTVSVLFVDLDWFKEVNDEYGHDVGDLVLQKVAVTLQQSVRKNDVVGRLGGDEFIICMYDIHQIQSLESLAAQIVKNISAITEIEGHPIRISASVGAVITHAPHKNAMEEMIKHADQLMYRVKNSGKGNHVCEEE